MKISKDPTQKWTGKEKQQYIKEKFNIEVTQVKLRTKYSAFSLLSNIPF